MSTLWIPGNLLMSRKRHLAFIIGIIYLKLMFFFVFFILFIIYIYWLNIINNSTFCYISFDINEFSPDFTANRDNAPFDKGMTWNSEINIE